MFFVNIIIRNNDYRTLVVNYVRCICRSIYLWRNLEKVKHSQVRIVQGWLRMNVVLQATRKCYMSVLPGAAPGQSCGVRRENTVWVNRPSLQPFPPNATRNQKESTITTFLPLVLFN